VENVRKVMTKSGVEQDEIVVHLASCVVNDNGHYPPCPHVDDMRLILSRKGFRVADGSRISQRAEQRRQNGTYRKREE